MDWREKKKITKKTKMPEKTLALLELYLLKNRNAKK